MRVLTLAPADCCLQRQQHLRQLTFFTSCLLSCVRVAVTAACMACAAMVWWLCAGWRAHLLWHDRVAIMLPVSRLAMSRCWLYCFALRWCSTIEFGYVAASGSIRGLLHIERHGACGVTHPLLHAGCCTASAFVKSYDGESSRLGKLAVAVRISGTPC
jgi:hypothetical protein